MSKSKRSYEERIEELRIKEQAALETAKKYEERKKQLERRKKDEEARARTHRLIEVGAAVESVLGCPVTKEDLPKLTAFLKRQEANGKYFSRAMGKHDDTGNENGNL